MHNHEHGVVLRKIQRVFGGFCLRFVHATSLNASMEISNWTGFKSFHKPFLVSNFIGAQGKENWTLLSLGYTVYIHYTPRRLEIKPLISCFYCHIIVDLLSLMILVKISWKMVEYWLSYAWWKFCASICFCSIWIYYDELEQIDTGFVFLVA